MKPGAVPVAQKPRQVPYYLQEPFRKWLDQGINGDIFEKVPDDEPITWCSAIVLQPKPKFAGMPLDKLEPHMIRAQAHEAKLNFAGTSRGSFSLQVP